MSSGPASPQSRCHTAACQENHSGLFSAFSRLLRLKSGERGPLSAGGYSAGAEASAAAAARRRGGAGAITRRSAVKVITAPASVCFSLIWPASRAAPGRSRRAPPPAPRPCRVRAGLPGRRGRSRGAASESGFPPPVPQNAAASKPWSHVPALRSARNRSAPSASSSSAASARAARAANRARLRESQPSAANSGISSRSRGRVKRGSALLGSVAKSSFALVSVAISRCFGTSSNGRARTAPSRRRLARHRRQAGDAAAARQPHQHRLGLIVAGVGRHDMAGAAPPWPPAPAADSAPRAPPPASPVVGLSPRPAQRPMRQVQACARAA